MTTSSETPTALIARCEHVFCDLKFDQENLVFTKFMGELATTVAKVDWDLPENKKTEKVLKSFFTYFATLIKGWQKDGWKFGDFGDVGEKTYHAVLTMDSKSSFVGLLLFVSEVVSRAAMLQDIRSTGRAFYA